MYAKNQFCRAYVVLATVLVSANSQCQAGPTLAEACRQAIDEQKYSDTVSISGHGFRIKPVTIEKKGDTLIASGYLVHKIAGTDDRVYYTIEMKKGKPYSAKITKIYVGGILGKGGKADIGLKWTSRIGGGLVGAFVTESPAGAVKGGKIADQIGNAIRSVLSAIQRPLIGNWTAPIPQILDGLATHLASKL